MKNPIYENNSYNLRNINELKPHPKNYKKHPDDQLKHLCKSIEENGLYRHIVIANDDTILAGHGVILACQKLDIKKVPTVKLPIDSTSSKAIKLLTADNEVGHLAISDDRQLSDILKQILDDGDLLGTGYDEMMLSNLLYVTRPESEIKTLDEAKEWVGLPEYEKSKIPLKMIVSFENEDDRREFARVLSIPITDKTKSTWFPYKENDDTKSVEFSDEEWS